MENKESHTHPSTSFELKYKDTTFYGLFKTKGIGFFKNWSLLWAAVFTIFVYIPLLYHGDLQSNLTNVSNDINEILIGASAGIFGIVIAALAVTIALFHQSLLPRMLETGLLQRYLFPFWKAVSLWCISIVICLFLIIFETVKINGPIPIVFTIEIFIFLYATFYTVKLSGLVIQLALQRAQIK